MANSKLMSFFMHVALLIVLLGLISMTFGLHSFAFLAAALAGFFISFFNMGHKAEKAQVKKSFKPGKYIASKSGSKFHAPKCDWAKRVKKSNAVWFNSKEEAKKAGYKADDCVK